MIGEPVVEELKRLISCLGYLAASWEWSAWEKGHAPRIHFLKITLLPKTDGTERKTLFSTAGLSLVRSTTPIESVLAFVDYCLGTRQLFEETHNEVPVQERGFDLGPYRVPLFGNFPSNRPEFYGSWQASRLYFYRSRRPFFYVSYALHDSVKARIPQDLTLHSGSPPFANPREVYQHYFHVDIGEGSDTWVGILAPVHVAHIKSYKRIEQRFVVELEAPKPMPPDLFLSIVCRGKEGRDFRRRIRADRKKLVFPMTFKPESVDVALYVDELRIDFYEWRARIRSMPFANFPPAIVEDHNPYEAPSQGFLFELDFLDRQHPDLRYDLEQANGCAANRLWRPATLLLRSALETAVNLKLKQLGRNEEIYSDGYERSLPARLEILSRELPQIRRELADSLTVKWFGDRGAHSKMKVYEDDVRAIVAPRLRSLLTALDLRTRGKSR